MGRQMTGWADGWAGRVNHVVNDNGGWTIVGWVHCGQLKDQSGDIYVTKTRDINMIHYKEKQHIHSCKIASLLLLSNIYEYIQR
jgi:hypothetical protein